MFVCYSFAFIGLLFNAVNGQSSASEACVTPNGEAAHCISIYDCEVLYRVLSNREAQIVKFLRASQCAYNNEPYVCCGTTSTYQSVAPKTTSRPPMHVSHTTERLLPNRSNCGFQGTDRILGGTATDILEYPWMALLQYRVKSGGYTFSCGGALINNKYILTAAHCVKGNIVERVGPIVSARLGEWNISTEIDCIPPESNYCNQKAVQINVEEALPHPEYVDTSADRHHDIALLRLAETVEYTDFIKPICLPTSAENSSPGANLWVAGWGRTEEANYSPVKLKVKVPLVANSRCASTFRSVGINVADSQLCAGGEHNMDSCNGDSGGPLMRPYVDDSSQWFVEGIVSFGAKCGTQNWPGIYTRVSEYTQWIEENVRE